ncbi:class I mannose-6-phosphate isomerase [Azospirillum doebereinerae]
MAIEPAALGVVRKPWGSTDLRPWSAVRDTAGAIGELWFERADRAAPETALLLKLLFTTQPLSIQVHPDDAFARTIGLDHGKTEAWYILSAMPGAKVAVGLKRPLSAPELRAAIEDGSIADLVQWRRVRADDVIHIPAGTIHAIGAGLVVAEIQQRSDTTFRLFDHGRERPLHVDKAVATAHAGPAERQSAPKRLDGARTLLVASPYFVLERIDLPASTTWEFNAGQETWLLALAGQARVGPLTAFVGEAIYLDAETTSIKVGADGLTGLLAYVATEPDPNLLFTLDGRNAGSPIRFPEMRP